MSRFTDNNLARFDRQIYGDYSQGDPRIYGNYINAINAFNKSYNNSTRGRGSNNPVGSVKTQYENQLRKYLNKLPEDVDLGAVPEKYRNNISRFLMKQKQEYVNAANVVDEYEVGSKGYMQTVSKMNTIRASFERLDAQMKAYGKNKKDIVEDIENQSISLYGENQMNANLLRGVYNEEYDLNIDEFGGVSFVGDDGVVTLDDLPDYEPKDYAVANAMMDMGVKAYQNGVILNSDSIMYQNYRNKLNIALDKGGVPTIMSVIHDGLVGDTKMINDPSIAQAVEQFQGGEVSFEDLRNIVVNKYMGVIQQQSRTGYNVKQAKVEKAKKIKEQESLRASEENALNTMLNIGNAAKDIGYQPGMAINQQQLDNLNLYNKSGMYLQKSEDSDTKIDVFSGSSYKYSFDTTDPAFLQQLFKAAGVSNNYWNLYPGMSENTNTDNTQQNQTQGTPQQTGGAYDNIGQSN